MQRIEHELRVLHVHLDILGDGGRVTLTPEMEEMFIKASKAWGQSVEDAKKETLKTLQSEL